MGDALGDLADDFDCFGDYGDETPAPAKVEPPKKEEKPAPVAKVADKAVEEKKETEVEKAVEETKEEVAAAVDAGDAPVRNTGERTDRTDRGRGG